MSAWESIFIQSRANNGYYDEHNLPQLKWDWPKGTWFQARRDHVRERQSLPAVISSKKMTNANELRTM